MELIWLVLSLIVVDVAALLFGADSRPGIGDSYRRSDRRRSAII
jgi:hypothetical protein